MSMNWDESLPDVSCWRPIQNNNTLKSALEMTCQLAQHRIQSRSKAEVLFNIFNYDSGSGVEDIVREELSNLLPDRYSIEAGVVNDRHGKTAGDCDLIIRDRIWSPVIKLGATSMSRRYHFPIEGVYAAAEIKQTLGFAELDAAMKKLVTISGLERPGQPLWPHNGEPTLARLRPARGNAKSSPYQRLYDRSKGWPNVRRYG